MSEQCATCKGEGCASIGMENCGQYQPVEQEVLSAGEGTIFHKHFGDDKPTIDSLFDGSDAHLLDERAEFTDDDYKYWCDFAAFEIPKGNFWHTFSDSENKNFWAFNAYIAAKEKYQSQSVIDAKRIAGLEALLAESRANDVAAMGWIADARSASGFNADGKMPEFVEYLRGVKEQFAAANQKLAEQQALSKIMAGALETCMEVDTGGTNKDQMFNLPSIQSALRKYYLDEGCEPLTTLLAAERQAGRDEVLRGLSEQEPVAYLINGVNAHGEVYAHDFRKPDPDWEIDDAGLDNHWVGNDALIIRPTFPTKG